MDEFDAFVMEDIQNAFDFETYRREKALRNVYVAFTMRD